MLNMNKSVVDFKPNTYADEGGQICKVDCSLGVNLEPLPDKVIRKLNNLSANVLKDYPHDDAVYDCLLKKLNKLNPSLKKENIAIGCGSIDILQKLNNLFLDKDTKVLGYSPQFSAYIDDVRMKGAKYVSTVLNKSNNYKLNPDAICKQILEEKPSFVYIDNPNNPTGQIYSKDELEKIWKSAKEVNAALLVDEAYGDYMDQKENSVVDKVNHWDGLIVTKTLSKGYGMAGMRFGYVVAEEYVIKELGKLLVGFNSSGLSRELAIAMLEDDDYLEGLKEITESKVRRIKETLTGSIKMAETADCVPISLLYTEDETINLAKVLSDNGIATVTGVGFEGIGANTVRLMVPAEKDMPLLCELLKQAEKEISNK